MTHYYITRNNFINFLQTFVKQYRVYGLIAEGDDLSWQRLNPENTPNITVNRYRAVQPIKSFFFPVKEDVTTEPSDAKTMLVGVKACDLNHLKTSDAIFTGGVIQDPYYTKKREETVIISSDCDSYKPSCFCTKMNELPYASKGFDLNLSPTRHGYLVETGTQRGQALVNSHKHLFQDPQAVLLQERDNLRAKITENVKANNRDYTWTNSKNAVNEGYDSDKWDSDIAKSCVECDACRFTCGNCYCFLLSETSKLWGKIRTWDSCQSAGYFRVAGGGNPKKTKGKRLRNFYACKHVYRPDNFGFSACTGCGRCIDVCQGRIDVRKSLQKLKEGAK
jgi:hypothetical protein